MRLVIIEVTPEIFWERQDVTHGFLSSGPTRWRFWRSAKTRGVLSKCSGLPGPRSRKWPSGHPERNNRKSQLYFIRFPLAGHKRNGSSWGATQIASDQKYPYCWMERRFWIKRISRYTTAGWHRWVLAKANQAQRPRCDDWAIAGEMKAAMMRPLALATCWFWFKPFGRLVVVYLLRIIYQLFWLVDQQTKLIN